MTRARILDAALSLMSEHGVAGTSMRMLAGECGLNVATLYHHFPSKADLLRAVLSERGYVQRLDQEGPPDELLHGTPDERLGRFVRWLWLASLAEESVWRLLVGESLRGDASARVEANALVDAIDGVLPSWLDRVVPELGERNVAVARLVRAQLFSLVVEHLALGPDDDRSRERTRALVEAIRP